MALKRISGFRQTGIGLKNNMKVKMKKGDIIILVLVLFSAGIMLFVLGNQKQGEYVHVTANGKTVTYAIGGNRRITLENGVSGYNTVIIKDGKVFMENASCPDQICVKHKAVWRNQESIICLPNEVYIEIESKAERDTDN